MNYRYSIFFLILIFLVSCKKEEPVASFSVSKTQAEVDEVITITNSSEHSTNYAWDFGDGTTSTADNPGSHQYSTDGVFTIELTATGEGGSDVASQTVTVAYPDPIAAFIMDKDSVELQENVTFTNQSENAASYSWSFGDGNTSTSQNPVHAYSEAGTFTVQLTATGPGGATSSTSESVTVVWPDPVADFTVDKTEAIPGETFTFTNASEYSESYSWDFGDGSTSTVTDPTHSYVDEGIYTVALTATGYNGETDTYSTAVSVCYPPEAEFIIDNYDPDEGEDVDVDLNFTNQSTNASSYVWDFGDGTTSTSENPINHRSPRASPTIIRENTGPRNFPLLRSAMSRPQTDQMTTAAPTRSGNRSQTAPRPPASAAIARPAAARLPHFLRPMAPSRAVIPCADRIAAASTTRNHARAGPRNHCSAGTNS